METWYVMEDGSVGDPREIAKGADGILRHKDGRAVAYAPHGPRSRGGVDPEKERAKVSKSKETASEPAVKPKDMRAETPKRPYQTRDQSAE